MALLAFYFKLGVWASWPSYSPRSIETVRSTLKAVNQEGRVEGRKEGSEREGFGPLGFRRRETFTRTETQRVSNSDTMRLLQSITGIATATPFSSMARKL